jgi:hypothetical protein
VASEPPPKKQKKTKPYASVVAVALVARDGSGSRCWERTPRHGPRATEREREPVPSTPSVPSFVIHSYRSFPGFFSACVQVRGRRRGSSIGGVPSPCGVRAPRINSAVPPSVESDGKESIRGTQRPRRLPGNRRCPAGSPVEASTVVAGCRSREGFPPRSAAYCQ